MWRYMEVYICVGGDLVLELNYLMREIREPDAL